MIETTSRPGLNNEDMTRAGFRSYPLNYFLCGRSVKDLRKTLSDLFNYYSVADEVNNVLYVINK